MNRVGINEFIRLLWLSGHAPGLTADIAAWRFLKTKPPQATIRWVNTMFKLWEEEAAKVLVPYKLSTKEKGL